jgi:hypothetical protein
MLITRGHPIRRQRGSTGFGRAVPAICALLTAGALSACGGGSSSGANAAKYPSGSEHQIAALVDTLQNLSRAGNASQICSSVFTAQEAATIARRAGATCEQQVKRQIVSPSTTYSVTAIHAHRTWALVNVVEASGRKTGLYMVSTAAGWRIASIYPVS